MAKRRRWGQGSVVQEDSGSFGVRWRENGKRRYKGGFRSKDLAERLRAKIIGELAHFRAGLPPDPEGFPLLAEEANAWLERRELTHRAWEDDRGRWRNHLKAHFGHLRAADVDAGRIRAFIEDRLRAGLDPATVGHCVRLLSTFFSDLCERPRETGAATNPVRTLPRSARRLMRPRHDPKRTPFLRELRDIQKLHAALPEPIATAFAVGVFGGLRTGEVLAVAWEDIDPARHEIHVHQQVSNSRLGPLKDDEARTVPVLDALAPALRRFRLATGGRGRLFGPDRPGRRSGRNGTPAQFMRPNTLHNALETALADCKLPDLTWYQATRHTFASQWVIDGGSMERLALILGHSSTEVTRRYAHLLPDHLGAEDRRRLKIRLVSGQSLGSGRDTAKGTRSKTAAKSVRGR